MCRETCRDGRDSVRLQESVVHAIGTSASISSPSSSLSSLRLFVHQDGVFSGCVFPLQLLRYGDRAKREAGREMRKTSIFPPGSAL